MRRINQQSPKKLQYRDPTIPD